MNFAGQFDIKQTWARNPSPLSSKKSESSIPKRPNSQQKNPLRDAGRMIAGQQLPPKAKSDKQLTTLLVQRVSKLQKLCTSQRQQIKENMDKMERLNAELTWFRNNVKSDHGYAQNQKLIQEVKKSNKRLKVATDFLAKYGIKWKEDQLTGQLQLDKLNQDLAKPMFRVPKEIDLASLMRRVDQLNHGIQISGGVSQVYKNEKGIAMIKKTEPIALGLYSDGLIFQGYAFYKYNSKEGARILADIMDGYFPYILKRGHPEGTLIKIVDKLDKVYGTVEDKKGLKDLQSLQDKKISPIGKQEFLDRLPKQVIKNGRVIQVRAAIQRKLNGSQQKQIESELLIKDESGNSVLATEEYQRFKQGLIQNLTALKIRSKSGSKNIHVYLDKGRKVRQIFSQLAKVMAVSDALVSRHPDKRFQKESLQTLEKAGLHPNAALQMVT